MLRLFKNKKNFKTLFDKNETPNFSKSESLLINKKY